MDDPEQQRRRKNASRAAFDWTREHPPGTPVLAWPGTRDVEPLVTRTRSSAWVMSIDDVVVQVDGHAGGIAITHIDHDPTRQPAVPDVEFEMPPCPICARDLDSDGDSLVCYPCGTSWGRNGTGGRWNDPAALRCLATVRPYLRTNPELVEACVLAKDHDLRDNAGTQHRSADGLTSWDDSHAGAVTDSGGEVL
jgi:hypothetical protein